VFKEPIRKNLSEMASYPNSHSILIVLVFIFLVRIVTFLFVILGIFLVIFASLVE
jgi:hypothetical protein